MNQKLMCLSLIEPGCIPGECELQKKELLSHRDGPELFLDTFHSIFIYGYGTCEDDNQVRFVIDSVTARKKSACCMFHYNVDLNQLVWSSPPNSNAVEKGDAKLLQTDDIQNLSICR